MFKKLDDEGRITDKDWNHYTQHRVVFKPEKLSEERLEEIYRYVWKETYRMKNGLLMMKNIMKRVRGDAHADIISRIACFTANMGFKFLGVEGV